MLEVYGDERPKISTACLTAIDSVEVSVLPPNTRLVISKYYERTADQTRKELALRIVGKCARREALGDVPAINPNVSSLELTPLPNNAQALVMSLDRRGTRLLVADSSGAVTMMAINFDSTRVLWRIHQQEQELLDFTSVCFSFDSVYCALGTVRGYLFVLEVATGRTIYRKYSEKFDRVWFVSFATCESTVLCYGQGHRACAIDLRTNEMEELCTSHRLNSTFRAATLDVLFISTEHVEELSRSVATVFKVERLADGVERTFRKDVVLGGNQLVHAIGISSRFALISQVGSNSVSMHDAFRGIAINHLDRIFCLNADSEVESCYSSATGNRSLFVSTETGEICVTDGLRVLHRQVFPLPILSATMSSDGSMALIQQEDEGEGEGQLMPRIVKLDLAHADRERMLALCKMDRTPVDILRRIKRFLI